MSVDSCLVTYRAEPSCDLTLVCVPYAGGGASVFRPWASLLSPAISLMALQLPGRENRNAEQPLQSMEEIVELCGPALARKVRPPYALFGHSAGALIAFALAKWLENETGQGPIRLMVAASRSAHSAPPAYPLYRLPHRELHERLYEMGGTPRELLAHTQLMELMTPLLRADLRICETYRCSEAVRVSCPILAFAATDDSSATPEEVAEWRTQTSGSFSMCTLQGGHFFIRETDAARRILSELMQSAGCLPA